MRREPSRVMEQMANRTRHIRWTAFVTWISIGILIGTEVYAVALAGTWAFAGMMELPPTLTYALYVMAFSTASYLMFLFMKGAAKIERLTE
jgi:hypothetical protein